MVSECPDTSFEISLPGIEDDGEQVDSKFVNSEDEEIDICTTQKPASQPIAKVILSSPAAGGTSKRAKQSAQEPAPLPSPRVFVRKSKRTAVPVAEEPEMNANKMPRSKQAKKETAATAAAQKKRVRQAEAKVDKAPAALPKKRGRPAGTAAIAAPSAQPDATVTTGRANRSAARETAAAAKIQAASEPAPQAGRRERKKAEQAVEEEQLPAPAPIRQSYRASSKRKATEPAAEAVEEEKTEAAVVPESLKNGRKKRGRPAANKTAAAVAPALAAAQNGPSPSSFLIAPAATPEGALATPQQPASLTDTDNTTAAAAGMHSTPSVQAAEAVATASNNRVPRDAAGAARDWLIAALANPRENTITGAQKKNSDLVQNNSVVITGGRGSGKTLAVERALAAVESKWNQDPADPLVGIIRITGSIHSNERTAFKEIARQICQTFNLPFFKSASIGDNMNFLRECLDAIARADKVAVFVLEEFHLFARKPKQTLLYTLFDDLQKTGVRAVVLGTTTDPECINLLEKRVKSRFHHRNTDIGAPPSALPIENYGNAGASPIPAPVAADGASPGASSSKPSASEGAIEVLRHMLTLPSSFPHKKHVAAHNTAVKAAFDHPSTLSAVKDFVIARNGLHQLAVLAQGVVAESYRAADKLIPSDAIATVCKRLAKAQHCGQQRYISGLSVLELAVLASAFRAARRVDGEAVNFEMAYKEFLMFSSSGDHVDNYSKAAACKAFHRLIESGLLSRPGTRNNARAGYGSNYAPVEVQITLHELRAGIAAHETCPSRLRDFATREGGPVTTAAALY